MRNREALQAFLVLAAILCVIFFPAIGGNKTLLMSAWNAPSTMSAGAYYLESLPEGRVSRTPDPGAPAWQTEAWFKIISEQFWTKHEPALWNPHAAYGAPLAANMQAQPYYPLTVLLSIHTTPWTYNFFIVARLLVAGVLMFLYARLFLASLSSLVAAVTFMLSGYFINYLNMPHLSVEVLLPGVFLGAELVLRRNSWRAAAVTAVMVFLTVVGGFPEAVFLMVSFACLYFLFRLLLTPEFRKQPLGRLGKFAADLLGFALSGFLLLPFLEYMRIAYDAHQPSNADGARAGLAFDTDFLRLFLYLLPMSFGPVGGSIFRTTPAGRGCGAIGACCHRSSPWQRCSAGSLRSGFPTPRRCGR